MADNYYGVDQNGNPTADSGNYTPPPSTCPDGQKMDTSTGQCVPVSTTQTPPSTATVGPGGITLGNTISGKPTGIPDPRYPGYDTGGFKLGSSVDASGNTIIPQAGGASAVTPAGTISTYLKAGDPTPTPQPIGTGQGASPQAPNVPAPPSYQFTPYTGTGTYSPYQYLQAPQFQSDQTQGMTGDLIQKLLTTTSMNPDVVAQMKEGQKGSILDMQNQVRQQILQNAASRNVAGGGKTLGNLANLDMSTIGDISKAYSGIDVAAAAQNQTDKLNAVGASDAFNSMLMQQFLGNQNLKLGTEQAQAGENQAASNINFGQYSTQEALKAAASNSAFMSWLQSQGLDLSFLNNAQNYGLAVSKFLAGGN